MTNLTCLFGSQTLELNTHINILLPSDIKQGEKVKVLYLLHGYFGDHTDWIRLTSIERYIEKYRVAVVMPSANNSYYTDMVYGLRYFTYMTEELPKFIERTFPISSKREDQYIAGLSMGGYGALKIALSNPDRYHKAASLSGALDLEHIRKLSFGNGRQSQYEATFGLTSTLNTNNDLKYLISNMTNKQKEALDLFIGCGTEDFLYQDNIEFISYLKSQNLSYTYVESKGAHEWSFWDTYIQKVIQWMFQK
ncbi:MAG: esterase family protein [Firmicutes bacterium]|nr:esterase family protein [Bacillota bacterium]